MENSPPNILPISGQPIPDCDIDAFVIRAGRGDLHYAAIEFDAAARSAVEASRTAEALLYQSLSVICSFAADFDSLSEPYQPQIRMQGRRSATPNDLTGADLDAVAQLRTRSAAALLRARLGDILWIRRKDHVAAKEAAADYLSAGKAFLTKEDWIFSVKLFQRALQLGHRLGRKNEAWRFAESATIDALESPLAKTEPFFASFFLGILEKMGAGDPSVLADTAKAHAERANGENDARRTRIYFEHEAKFRAAAKDSKGEQAARLAAAMSYEAEADHFLARTPPSYSAAGDSLAHGIEALRRAHGDPAIIARLKVLLKRYQREALKEMKTYSHEVDLSQSAEEAVKLVENDDFQEALKLLAFGRPLTSPDAVRAEVLKLARDFPISHLFGASVVDGAGRVKEHIEPLVGEGTDAEAGIEARTFKYAAEFPWRFRAIGYIEPARRKIWAQHFPQQGALDFLVENNPFIPRGHEGIYRRGLYYGLCGDMLLAAHLLAPQLENSIRYFLEENGVDVSNLESDLTQPVKTLGPLLALPETTTFFGPEYVFELKGLLIEKLGYSFRHRIAHGFASEGECYGPECSNLWWLSLRLCYTPVVANPPDTNGIESERASGGSAGSAG